MDQILAVFIGNIKFVFLSFYLLLSGLVDQAAKGSVLAWMVLIVIVASLVAEFLRLVLRPRRPRGRR
jgi:FtsH-binding integral membrane protein